MAFDKDGDMYDAEASDDVSKDSYKKDFKTALPQILAVSVKNLLLLGYGMTLGFPTILMPAVSNPIKGEVLCLEKTEISWISSLNLIVVPLGCALSGVVTSPMGRRRAMQMVNIPFFIAWLILYFSSSTSHLYGALFLTGLGGGLMEAPVLTYVADISQPHLRGMLTATSSMCIILGVFTQFLFGLFLYWRIVALVNIIFTVSAVIALFFIPESPHWLVYKKRHDDARKSLQWLRGWTTSDAVEHELKDIQALYKKEQVQSQDVDETFKEKMSHYFKKSFLVPYFLVCYSFFVGHFSGMTTLQMLEAPIDKYYATLVLGIMQILGTGTCVLLVHYTGKRPLAIFSTAGAALCCLVVVAYEGYIRTYGIVVTPSLTNDTGLDKTNGTAENIEAAVSNPFSWIPTLSLMLLALITHMGIRMLPWILIGEVFSAKTRSDGAGLAGAVGYIFSFLTNKMYISMVDSLSIWGTYGFYGIVCFTGTIVLYYILPETEGKKLNDIQNHFAGIKKITNKVYRSKRRAANKMSKMHVINGKINPSYEDDHHSKL